MEIKPEIKLHTEINTSLYITSKQDSLNITYYLQNDKVSVKMVGRYKTRKEAVVTKNHVLVDK